MHLNGGGSVERLLSLPGFAVFSTAADAAPDITMHLDTTLPAATGRMLHRFDIVDGQAECQLLAEGDGGYRYNFSTGGSVAWHPDSPAVATIEPVGDPATLRFAVWLAYSMTAAPLGRMPVHSSVVTAPLPRPDGTTQVQAVMCLGESGTGKSTHTRLWLQHIAGARLLNDDSPIISVADSDGTVQVYGSPWSGKAPCFRQEHHPLAALLRLEQRPQNSIRRLHSLEAFGALQPSCPPAMAHDERLLDMVVDTVDHVISRVPIYRLGCLPDAEAAHLAFNTISNGS